MICYEEQIGLILDAGIEEDLRLRHLQVINATRASLGLPIMECIVTDTPLKVWYVTRKQNEHSILII